MGWLTFVDFANFRFMVEYFIAIAFMQPDIMESITIIIILATTNTIATVVITIIVTITIIVVAIATMLIYPSPNSLLCI